MPTHRLQNGEILHYRQIGTSGPAVVLLHGFGVDSRFWVPFAWPLRNRFRFFIPDLPGVGLSYTFGPPEGDVLELYANAVLSLIEAHDLKDIHLVGFSLGAMVSLQIYTQTAFANVRSYTHIDHTPFVKTTEEWEGGFETSLLEALHSLCQQVESEPSFKAVSFDRLPHTITEAYATGLQLLGEMTSSSKSMKALTRWTHRAPVLRRKVIERVAWPWAYAILHGYYSGRYDFRETLKSIPIPVHIVSGGSSKLFGSQAMRWMSQQIPGSTLHEFPESGHDLMYHRPFKFLRLLVNILSRS